MFHMTNSDLGMAPDKAFPGSWVTAAQLKNTLSPVRLSGCVKEYVLGTKYICKCTC